MKTEVLGSSKILNLMFKPAGLLMASNLRRRLFDPERTLRGAGIRPGQRILEVGCGTGFFTVPAARLVGDHGAVLAMDVMTGFLEQVAEKVHAAGLMNVTILKRDALDTRLESSSIDTVLLFGVVPFPSLPLKRLLPEMHRVLKPDGRLAVWLFPVSGWVPASIARSGLFSDVGRNNGVYNYRRCEREAWALRGRGERDTRSASERAHSRLRRGVRRTGIESRTFSGQKKQRPPNGGLQFFLAEREANI